MSGRLAFALIAAAVGLGVGNGLAVATPGEGDVVRTDVAKGTNDEAISIVTAPGQPTTLLVQNLVLKPGAHSGWHTHPGPEYSVITGGGVAVQTEQQCGPTNFAAGQTVFIPAGLPHRVANDGAADASVVVNYTVPADAPVRVDAPDACQK